MQNAEILHPVELQKYRGAKLLRKSHDVGGVVTSFKKDLIPLLSASHDVAVRADGECGTGSNITPR